MGSTTKFDTDFIFSSLSKTLTIAPSTSGSNQEFSNITTDSRFIKPRSLFVAIPGEKFDGHDFIDQAIAAGATGILTSRPIAGDATPKGTQIFLVPDTIQAYRTLAHHWRKKFKIPVLAVAGSVGKTTTKELLAAVLSGKFKSILKTQGSQNGFVGIPMTLLELNPRHEVAVIEVGIDEIGAMAQHIPIVEPTAAIVTAIDAEHLEKLIDLPTVAQEELIALELVSQSGGQAVVNLDDEWIFPIASHFAQSEHSKTVFGFTLNGDRFPTPPQGITHMLTGKYNGNHLEVSYLSGVSPTLTQFECPLPGIHNARNLLGALTLAYALGLSPAEMQKGLQTFKGAQGRSEFKSLPNGTRVLCDYYNANPASVKAALELMATPSPASTWLCLGDMLELGPGEETFHRALARPIQDLGFKHLLLFGPRMKWLQAEIQTKNPKYDVRHFDTHAALTDALIRDLKPSDQILIKGSRGMKMETIWELLWKSH